MVAPSAHQNLKIIGKYPIFVKICSDSNPMFFFGEISKQQNSTLAINLVPVMTAAVFFLKTRRHNNGESLPIKHQGIEGHYQVPWERRA